MLLAIPYPHLDPVLLQLGPFAIRWYALAYVVGLLAGWRYCVWLGSLPPMPLGRALFDDFLVWAVLGVILGGRLGYVIFYNGEEYLQNPLKILMVWHGGMSFHGGLIGVILAMILFARSRGLPFFALADVLACATPIGLFFGRLANYNNGELFGRVTDVPWAMIFDRGGPEPRHPSQLYEAALEGIVLFLVLFYLARFTPMRGRLGLLSGVFLTGYGLCRFFVEFLREPDPQLGFLTFGTTMGQLLSLPMILIGLVFILRAKPAPQSQ
jgi:phosphatidylglycerol:prolipoprotein diacylglycerol transferase